MRVVAVGGALCGGGGGGQPHEAAAARCIVGVAEVATWGIRAEVSDAQGWEEEPTRGEYMINAVNPRTNLKY